MNIKPAFELSAIQRQSRGFPGKARRKTESLSKMTPSRSLIDPADEANQLAKLFYALSQATDDLRTGDALVHASSEDLVRLKDKAQALNDVAHSFTAQAIGLTLQGIQHDLANIKAVTAEATAQLDTLNEVSKAIGIASAALGLGATIATGDPGSIAAATKTLFTALG